MRSILITGGSGTFGRAFAKRLLESSVDRICIYSRGEHRQAEMRTELGDHAKLRWFIGDIRDRERLRLAMRGCDAVVHAAALKRIEVGLYNPDEMVQTNILGALNVIRVAHDEGVRRVLALSTDKAVAPVSMYGISKAAAECLFRAANNPTTKYAIVRYGNIAGSQGSVIPIWRRAIAEGRRIRITDSDCTRYWMRIEEAVDLVWNTLRYMAGGEVMIPTLPAYRLGDLAVAMGVMHADHIGLPDHEKMHETMDGIGSSNTARRMSVPELKEALTYV